MGCVCVCVCVGGGGGGVRGGGCILFVSGQAVKFTETDIGNRVVFCSLFFVQTAKFTETDTGNSFSFSAQTAKFTETDTGNSFIFCSVSEVYWDWQW